MHSSYSEALQSRNLKGSYVNTHFFTWQEPVPNCTNGALCQISGPSRRNFVVERLKSEDCTNVGLAKLISPEVNQATPLRNIVFITTSLITTLVS